MPQARRSTSTRSGFKHPPALKRLSTSLDTAQKALAELSKGSGREAGKGAGDLYKDLRTFVSNARRDSNKLAKALQREFDQAQKQLSKAASGTRSSSGRSRSTSGASKSGRSTSSRSTSSRSTSSRSKPSSSSSRSSSGRGTSKRSSSSGTKRTSSRRGTSKS